MSWTYSGDPSTSEKDQVRFMIGDTDERTPQMTDEEILFLLSTEGTPLKAAIGACKGLFAKYLQQVDYTIGPESVKAGDRAKAYRALCADLESKLNKKDAAPSFQCPAAGAIFDIGIDDNRRIVPPSVVGDPY